MSRFFTLLSIFCFSIFYTQKKFPETSLKNIDGKQFSTSQFIEKDKIYVIPFWATWCAPCLEELEAFSEIYDEAKTKLNFEIIPISVDDSKTVKRVKPLVKGKGWNYNILLDTNQELKRKLGITVVPYLIVVKNGEIILKKSGHNPGGESQLIEELGKL